MSQIAGYSNDPKSSSLMRAKSTHLSDSDVKMAFQPAGDASNQPPIYFNGQLSEIVRKALQTSTCISSNLSCANQFLPPEQRQIAK